MARGAARKSDLEHLRKCSTNFLRGLDDRLEVSLNELTRYQELTREVLAERLEPTHPWHDLPDEGEDPTKTQSREFLGG